MTGSAENGRFPLGAHRWVAVVVGVGVGMIAAVFAPAFGAVTGHFDVGAAVTVVLMAAAGMVTFGLLARHFDRADPTASLGTACLRLLVPGLALAFACWWTADQSIFERTALGRFIIVPASVVLVSGALVLLRRQPAQVTPSQPGRAPTPATVAPPSSPSPPAPPSAPPHRSTRPPLRSGSGSGSGSGPIVHRVTSGSITAAWIPGGLVVLFLANWCPDDGEAAKTFVLSLLFVGVQFLGNAVAGWGLDGRYGSDGGVLVSIGRSVFVAIVLFAATLLAVSVISDVVGPQGASRYCG